MPLIRLIFVNLLILFFFSGCQNVKETLSMKKKQNVDEFLIEKKNPLILPPEFSKLPKPRKNITEENFEKDQIDLTEVLKKNDNSQNQTSSNDLEKSIQNILKEK